MRRSLVAVAAAASLVLTALWSTAPLAVVASRIDKMSPVEKAEKSKPLFAVDHPNITYLTDDNWDATMIQYSDRPWLVDFYHPFCPYCRRFAPVFEEAAAFFKADGRIYVGAISCMDHYKCSRIKIKGFPNLVAFNFDKQRPTQEVYRIFGSHTVHQMKDLVDRLFAEAAFNETGSYPPEWVASGVPAAAGVNASATTAPLPGSATATEAKPEEPEIKEQWEESTNPMNQTTRLQDAASAFIFGLKQGVFTGREVLEDVELDALKMWLTLVSKTFPGSINRKLIAKLSDEVASIPLLDMDTWHTLLKDWQARTVSDFTVEESQLRLDGVEVPEWQRLNDLFIGQGIEYEACALYTCGQWNMFHMLTMNPPVKRDPKLVVDVIATIRRFVKHFFGCIECRDHFLKYNNLEMVQKISAAEDKPLALKRWLWNMHNAVNKRINHPLWPKPDICSTCGSEGNWLEVEVDKWLGNTYEYREVEVPRVTTTPPPELLRKEDDEARTEKVSAASETTSPPTTQPPLETKAMDVANGGNLTAVQEAQQAEVGTELLTTEVSAGYEFQTSHLVLLVLPVVAVVGYLLFVRSSGRTTYHAVPASEPVEETVL